MKVKLILTTISVVFLFSGTALAAPTSNDMVMLEKSIQKLTVQTASMQQEIRSLRTQVKVLKARRSRQRVVVTPPTRYRHATATSSRPAYHWYEHSLVPPSSGSAMSHDYTQGVTVTTSPYLGIRSAFNGSDLVTNLSSMNEDLRLLRERQILEKHFGFMDSSFPMRPLIELSGKLEGEFIAAEPYRGSTTTDINLSSAELDTMVEFGPWATGLISLSYNDASPITGARVTNSNIALDRGFFTLGNLNQSPIYFTLGQMFVPFGRYSSQMVTTTVPQSMGRTKARAMLLGYSNRGLVASVYGFKGDSFQRNSGIINNGGVNLGYEWGTPARGGHIGVGVINNIADAEGIQSTGARMGFMGFGTFKPFSERLAQTVPAVDFNLNMTAWHYGLIVEYIHTLRSFNAADLSFNSQGARLHALNVELGHRFTNLRFPLGVAIGYEQTGDALGLNLPRRSFLVAANTSWWKNTIEAIEYRHDINYHSSDTASGKAAVGPTMGGGSRNIVTARVGVYF